MFESQLHGILTQTPVAPYKINKSRMDRVETLVDWALAEGLYVIINAHHETWLKKKLC